MRLGHNIIAPLRSRTGQFLIALPLFFLECLLKLACSLQFLPLLGKNFVIGKNAGTQREEDEEDNED